jgi:tetratricopeptide (TPR) repeat protein
VLSLLKRNAEASAAADAGIAADPSYADLYTEKAMMAEAVFGTDASVAILDNASAIIPDDPELPYTSGRYLADAKKYSDAIRYYDKAIAIDPQHQDA